MGIVQSLSITQNSQNIPSNYSVVQILWQSTQTEQSYNGYTNTAYYYISVNGGAEERHAVQYTLPKNSVKTILNITLIVPHNADGTGSIKVRTWMDTNIYEGEITQTKTLTLTTIPRQSSLSVGNGILGTKQTLTVTKQASSFTHTIAYKCGSMTGTICTKSTATSVEWTPPADLATQNPTGTSVQVTFTMTTYNGNTVVGTKSQSATYAIPENATPYFYITSTDPSGYFGTYGAYIQGRSKLNLEVDAYGTYGSWITSVKTEFDGKTYTSASFTSAEIVNTGKLIATIVVTDSRGRTATGTKEIDVLSYSYPSISSLSSFRSDIDGKADSAGGYLAVNLSSIVTSLNEKNQVSYSISYQKANEANPTTKTIADLDGVYSVSGTVFVFKAEGASSYNITVTITDAFGSVTKATIGPSIQKVWSMLKKAGKIVGLAINKIAELEGVFDIGLQTRFDGGLLHPILPTNSDLNAELTPKTYMLLTANTYFNTPESGIGAFLEIVGIKDGSIIQRYSIFDQAHPRVYERIHYATTGWGNWICVRGDFVVEQGEKDGWTYRKWNSGIAECRKTLLVQTSVGTAWGSMYVGSTKMSRQNYPFPFVSKPTETVSVNSGSNAVWAFAESGGNGVNGAYASAIYNVCRPSAVSGSGDYYFSFHVTGKWK